MTRVGLLGLGSDTCWARARKAENGRTVTATRIHLWNVEAHFIDYLEVKVYHKE